MNPSISKISDENDVYKFTLSGVNVSFANAIRRTILSEIPIVVIHTDTHENNQCNIMVNTSRLHNEILKQRISSIPICITELDLLPEKYVLEVDVINETENLMYVTTEDFRIRNKTTGTYLVEKEVRNIFPSNPLTNYFIDFARLRPKISDSIPGEHIKLVADFSISNAKHNSMYNVVSKCAYGNSPNIANIDEAWEQNKEKMIKEQATKEEIDFQKRNFMLLDAQRQFIPDSFDFVVQTLGIYSNQDIVKKACAILQNKFVDMIYMLESDTVLILNSESTMEYCYDVILENEDYTVGKVLEYILYERYYVETPTLSYCGFKKFHPHDTKSTIRLAFHDNSDRGHVKRIMHRTCVEAQEVFKKAFGLF